MIIDKPRFKRWLFVVLFAIAMAWMESAVVYYLRTLVDRIEPFQPMPLPIFGGFVLAELPREFATMVMIFVVGWLAGSSWRERFGYAAVVFGVWDIFYYVFLKVMCGWPHSLLDWDVLFLLPLPWWGPVLAPVLISMLMVVWGTLASQCELKGGGLLEDWRVWAFNFGGIAVALYVFMADAIAIAGCRAEAFCALLPGKFNWSLYCLALMMMSAPVLKYAWRLSVTGRTQHKNDRPDRHCDVSAT